MLEYSLFYCLDENKLSFKDSPSIHKVKLDKEDL